ncbi:MAG: phasin family protein [Hespellia sp.]|nr:phasin family protein [Hespellia sp.]
MLKERRTVMDKMGESLKKIVLAGIGAVAITADKSKDLLEELVKKGELTVEQGKVLNEELKHKASEKVKEKMTVKVTPESPEDMIDLVSKMTPEQIAQMKEKIAEMEKEAETSGSTETPDAEEIQDTEDA